MDLGVLLVRAPGAETPTPIPGYEYSFESLARVALPGGSAFSQFIYFAPRR